MRTVYSTVAALFSAFAVLVAAPAYAQDAYPNKPITMIIPFAAGGSTDVIGRLVADGLRQLLGQSIISDNRAGAGGSIGTGMIARMTAHATIAVVAR